MTDKVQKIREEVERLRNLHQIKYQNLDTNDNMCLVECGKRNLCNELLSFIDSIQEEPVSEELDEEIKNFLDKTGAPYYWAGEEEQLEWVEIIAQHFASWQKQQMMKDAVQGFVNAEYQDVVSVKSRAIAGEERKKLGLHLCAKIKLIIIKED